MWKCCCWSKIGAIPEIIKDRQLLFIPGEYKGLALILKKLFNKKYYMKKLKKQNYIVKNRSIQKQANLPLNLFRMKVVILAGGKGSRISFYFKNS